jgi:hypothetical protein
MFILADKRGIACRCFEHEARLGAWNTAGKQKKEGCRGRDRQSAALDYAILSGLAAIARQRE